VKKTFLSIATSFLLLTSGTNTQVQAMEALDPQTLSVSDISVVAVCDGHELSLHDINGERLAPDRIALHLAVISARCSSASPRAAQLRIAGNLNAWLTYKPSSGVLYVSASANSLVRGNYRISCIYRREPVSGAPGAWQDCTAVSGYSTTYLSTSTISFCPVPGTRWHEVATLSRPTSTTILMSVDAWETAY